MFECPRAVFGPCLSHSLGDLSSPDFSPNYRFSNVACPNIISQFLSQTSSSHSPSHFSYSNSILPVAQVKTLVILDSSLSLHIQSANFISSTLKIYLKSKHYLSPLRLTLGPSWLTLGPSRHQLLSALAPPSAHFQDSTQLSS